MVQRRAARLVYSNYQTTSSVSAMLSHLNWMSLQEHRAQAKALMMYRVVNQQIDIPSQILVPTISPRGNNTSYLVPYARTLIYQKSFFPDGIRIWNSLPSVAVCAPSVDSLKFQIQAVNIRGIGCLTAHVYNCFYLHLYKVVLAHHAPVRVYAISGQYLIRKKKKKKRY